MKKAIIVSFLIILIVILANGCDYIAKNRNIDDDLERDEIDERESIDEEESDDDEGDGSDNIDDNIKSELLKFKNIAKYNLFLYENVPIENIGIPIIIDYKDSDEIKEIEYKSFDGDNIKGINLIYKDSMYKWDFKNNDNKEEKVNVQAYSFTIETNEDYVYSSDPRKIDEVNFLINGKEYIIPVDIKLKDKNNYAGGIHNYKRVSIYDESIYIEVPALNEEWEYFDNDYIIKDFYFSDKYYDVSIDRYKKLEPKKSGGHYIQPVKSQDINKVYVDDYVFYDINIYPNNRIEDVFCSGDMFILELENKHTHKISDVVWGLYSKIDFDVARNVVNNYFKENE